MSIASLVILSSLMFSNPYPIEDASTPDVNVSAVRQIACDHWTGSGFLIGDKIMATANHVMDGGTGCRDVATGTLLHVYKEDKAHDLVLVTGPALPTDIPYIRIGCSGYKTGETYVSFGISGFGQRQELTIADFVVAQKDYTDESFVVAGSKYSWAGMRHLVGKGVPGMSGGFFTDLNGNAVGMVNVGARFFGLPLLDKWSYEFKDTFLCKP